MQAENGCSALELKIKTTWKRVGNDDEGFEGFFKNNFKNICRVFQKFYIYKIYKVIYKVSEYGLLNFWIS